MKLGMTGRNLWNGETENRILRLIATRGNFVICLNVTSEFSPFCFFPKSLVCWCAKKARKKAFTYFGLQFYGECWSGVRANVSYDNDGPSKGCVGKKLRQRCRHSDPLCVGKAKRNFIYKLVAPTSPPDCKDNSDVCEEYKEYCHYEHVRSNCRRSCKQC